MAFPGKGETAREHIQNARQLLRDLDTIADDEEGDAEYDEAIEVIDARLQKALDEIKRGNP